MNNIEESQYLESGNSNKDKKKKKAVKRKGKKYTQIADEEEYYDDLNNNDENEMNNNKNNRSSRSSSNSDRKLFKSRESPDPDGSINEEGKDEESVQLLSKVKPLEKIEFNNSREVRISRVNLGPIQQLPPQLDIHLKKNKQQKIPWKIIMTNVGVLTMYNYFDIICLIKIDLNFILQVIGLGIL